MGFSICLLGMGNESRSISFGTETTFRSLFGVMSVCEITWSMVTRLKKFWKTQFFLFSFLLFVIFWNLLECLCKCLVLIWFYDCSNIKIQGCYISYTLLSKLLFITEKRSFVVPPQKLDLDTFLSWQQTWSATSDCHRKRL